ncbi:hypothetical protein M3Y97_01010100 [Aphelenchoides bicaudatus]|nr:hypothetical protein M3Y97_01010100 [Aphelenchoides bicaudatus]
MDFLRELIGTRGNLTEIPDVKTWFAEMEPHYLILICLSVTFSILSIVLGCLHLVYVLRYISNEQIQADLYWIVFMCPVVSLCGSIGMILPRSAIFLYAVALVYFMICIFVMVTLMTTLHGSRQAMCEKAGEKGRQDQRSCHATWMLFVLLSENRTERTELP